MINLTVVSFDQGVYLLNKDFLKKSLWLKIMWKILLGTVALYIDQYCTAQSPQYGTKNWPAQWGIVFYKLHYFIHLCTLLDLHSFIIE